MRIPGSYEDLIAQARQARLSGQPGAAIALYSRVIDRLGDVLSKKPERDEQLEEYLITAADELQLVLDWTGDHAMAQALCQRMATLDSDDRPIWLRRAATERVYVGDVEGGLAELRQLVDEDPEEFWHPMELTTRLLEVERLDEAETALAEATRRAQDKEEVALVHWTRSRLLRERGQLDAAAQAWETACRHDAHFKQAAEVIYRMFIAAGDYASVYPYLDTEENALVAGYYRGLLAHYQGDKARAQKAWRRVVQNKPGEFQSGWEAWALAQIHLGEQQTALNFLSGLVRQGYTTEQCYLGMALAWAISGNAQNAKANLDIALRIQRQVSGPQALLPSDLWSDFAELVTDETLKQELQGYFADRPGNLQPSQG